jgi:hypothetical protein
MGFMDQVKAAATDLKESVESSLSSTNASRDVERHYRDLGMLTYLQETGRAIDPADRERILATIRQAEGAGDIKAFTLQTGTPPPPPPPPAAQPPPAAGPPPQEPPPTPPTPPPAAPQAPQEPQA